MMSMFRSICLYTVVIKTESTVQDLEKTIVKDASVEHTTIDNILAADDW